MCASTANFNITHHKYNYNWQSSSPFRSIFLSFFLSVVLVSFDFVCCLLSILPSMSLIWFNFISTSWKIHKGDLDVIKHTHTHSTMYLWIVNSVFIYCKITLNFARTCHINDVWLNNWIILKKKLIFGFRYQLFQIYLVHFFIFGHFQFIKPSVEHPTDVIKYFNRQQKQRKCSIVICHNVLMWLLFNHEYHGNESLCLKHMTCYIFMQTICTVTQSVV